MVSGGKNGSRSNAAKAPTSRSKGRKGLLAYFLAHPGFSTLTVGILGIALALCFSGWFSEEESHAVVQEEGSDPSAHQIIAHIRQKGGTLNFRPASFPGGLRGAAADRVLTPGAVVMKLPLDEVLFEETIAPEVRNACKALPCNISRALLALGLAYEKNLGEKSRFFPFVKTFPEEVTNLINWPKDLLRLMERAMPGTQSYLSHEMFELKGANALLPDPLPLDQLIWAVGMVQSRAFGGWDGNDVMIPGAGLLNHHWDPDAAIPMPTCDTKARVCSVVTGKRVIAKGQQLFFHYRPWSNLQLLIRYGFSVPENPWGPSIYFGPLANPPAWLKNYGCQAGNLNLKKSSSAGYPPLPIDVLRCARAAFMANISEAASEEARSLWQAGNFLSDKNLGKDALAEISNACLEASRKWTDPEGLEVLQAAASVTWHVALDVVRAVSHDLELLQACQDIFADAHRK